MHGSFPSFIDVAVA
jgi:arginyl-tRNA synthetase